MFANIFKFSKMGNYHRALKSVHSPVRYICITRPGTVCNPSAFCGLSNLRQHCWPMIKSRLPGSFSFQFWSNSYLCSFDFAHFWWSATEWFHTRSVLFWKASFNRTAWWPWLVFWKGFSIIMQLVYKYIIVEQ